MGHDGGGQHRDVDGNEEEKDYNDSRYDLATSSFSVPGLFPDFRSAATLLRMARPELRVDLISNGTAAVDDFYRLLDRVECRLERSPPRWASTATNGKFVVEVEGLDGSGKTTLVSELREALSSSRSAWSSMPTGDGPDVIASKTPSVSLKDVRPLWDHRGGILARAFYTASNYVLEHEIVADDDAGGDQEAQVVVVDRWYASTCAYTIAATGRKVSDLPNETFRWPRDLRLRPHVLLVLQIDPAVRRRRVEGRRAEGGGGASCFNPWDDLLAEDAALGGRILEAFGRIQNGPREICYVNANSPVETVVSEALAAVMPALQRCFRPEEYFRTAPFEWWKHESRSLGLCDERGRRAHHALWNLQVAYNISNDRSVFGRDSIGPPVLKTVGLDRIDSDCVYYWTPNAAFTSSSLSFADASILWTGGNYPVESQWRAEGYLERVNPTECSLRGFRAPPSLVAHVTACQERDSCSVDVVVEKCGQPDATSDGVAPCQEDYSGRRKRRPSRPVGYDDSLCAARRAPDPDSACMVRFVPHRVEVLRGGPSTRLPGFPQRWEWTRDVDRNGGIATNDWTERRSLLPFSRTVVSPRKSIPRGATIAVLGTHGSGKSTIGAALAKTLGVRFDPELGDVLREERGSLVADGHLYGNGSSATITDGNGDHNEWDDRIHDAECRRDGEQLADDAGGVSRVVETWHPGNAAWHQLRQRQKQKQCDPNRKANTGRYRAAVAKHQKLSPVLLVQLTISSSAVAMQRRERDPHMRERLPMNDEKMECEGLYQALQKENDAFLADATESLGVPVLRIDNGRDGEEAMNGVLREILAFVQRHCYRRVMVS